MDNWLVPNPFSEEQLLESLKEFSEKCECQIGYYLSSDEIRESTQFTYQASVAPRSDRPIQRCKYFNKS